MLRETRIFARSHSSVLVHLEAFNATNHSNREFPNPQLYWSASSPNPTAVQSKEWNRKGESLDGMQTGEPNAKTLLEVDPLAIPVPVPPDLGFVQAAATYPLVDQELVGVLKVWPQAELTHELLGERRKVQLVEPIPLPVPQPQNRNVPGSEGAPDVHVVIVDPLTGGTGRPVVLHMHGGGYIAENPMLYPIIQTMARDCQCVVVSVDYRLAPETAAPGSLEHNYAALKWVYENADELGIDRKRIALAGESAGGGHAAALAIHARDLGQIPILFQLLIDPMLDDRTGSSRPAPTSMGQYIWTEQSNRFGWTALLGVPAGSDEVAAGAVPARVEDLSGLPPAWIGTGSIDLFADEDVTYAQRLMRAGVPTQLLVVPGAYHGFDLLVQEAAVSKVFTESWKSALRRAFALE